ncbi:hypothetical protein ACFL27_10615 [candidate division CSSED10-310 bacterium]|uniref:Mannose-1-phosphate guanyltransferase C-terminal domain-containing protein n=1 Tax=candidate division CSSED10-310 bacterium TaxID=2855610 RepID=A0ABV6YX33_UNCC1
MKVKCIYLLEKDRFISPFGDPVAEVLIENLPLHEFQRNLLAPICPWIKRIKSVAEVEQFPCLLLEGDLYFTLSIIKKFVKRAKKLTTSGRLAHRLTVFHDKYLSFQELEVRFEQDEEIILFPVWFLVFSADLQRLSEINPVLVPVKERIVKPEMINRFLPEGESRELGISRDVIFQITHWYHILLANIISTVMIWLRLTPLRILRYIFWILTAFSLNKWQILRRFRYIGRNCDIHPEARIELSVIGDNVTIGRGAYIMCSIIGDNTTIDFEARLRNVVVGSNCMIAFSTIVNLATLYPGCLVSPPGLQLCVLGRNTFLAGGNYFIDLNLKKPIKVKHQGRIVPLKTNNMGVCVGHDVVLGIGSIIDAGVEIPNGILLIKDREQIIRKFADDLPTGYPLVLKDGVVQKYIPPSPKSENRDEQNRP